MRSRYQGGGATLRLYHGTSCGNVPSIKREGLRSTSTSIFPAKWFMLASDFDSAYFHSPRNEDACVIEFRVPVGRDRWPGYPYLWLAHSIDWEGAATKWYAIRETLPARFIARVHRSAPRRRAPVSR